MIEEEPRSAYVEVEGGRLHTLRWGTGDRVVVALHGITANAMSWRGVAARLPRDWSLVALDQRGRGRSRDLPGPYGVEGLARDAVAVSERLGAEVLAGHSLGAYVSVAAEHARPGTVERLVLVDGGIALPMPVTTSEEESDALLEAALGPMLARLGGTWASVDDYVDLFRAHPAMGPYWSDDLEAYARYDAVDVDGGVRAAASQEAVRVSGRELLTRGDDVRDAWAALGTATTLLTAPRGMTDGPEPFLPGQAVAEATRGRAHVRHLEVGDSNHYTVLLGIGAAAVADAVVTSRPHP